MNRQAVNGHWKIMADFPSKDGDYMVVFLNGDGQYGDPDIWCFQKGAWEPLFGYTPDDEPVFWLDVMMPK